jgi:UDP-3-O-[3-hydroxymyristoyl] glucosamine N-acyltransferase
VTLTTHEIAALTQGTLIGREDVAIQDVASLERCSSSDISFLDSTKHLRKLKGTTPGALFVSAQTAGQLPPMAMPLIVVKDSQGAFIQTMLRFRPLAERQMIGISPHAHVDPSARIGEGTNIHPGAYVGRDAVIGRNCDLFPHAVVREGATLGDECILHPHVVLYPGMQLGDRVIVHANAVIGADGFGYRFMNGRFEKLPHTGTVIVEDDVEIGACATIDRGMIGATRIGTGTKIDNLVMIAHNCQIGRHNAFASQVGFAGSCSTGDYVRCGGQVGIADHVNIGEKSSLGGKAGVMADLPAGGTYYGIPARPEKEAIKHHLGLMKIPEMREQLQQLAEQMQQLQQQLTAVTSQTMSKAA